MSEKEPLYLFGKVVGLHGLRGEVKVRPASNSPELQEGVTRLRTRATREFPAVDLEVHGIHFDKRMFYVSFAGYPDRTSVEHLMGAELLAWEEEIDEPGDDEFWVKDLIGMKVFKENGEEVGRVVDIVYGGNDLLEIRREQDPPGKTILVPFVKSIVPGVDLKERKLFVKDIPGLFEAQ